MKCSWNTGTFKKKIYLELPLNRYTMHNISEFKIGEEKVSRKNIMAGETVAHFEEE